MARRRESKADDVAAREMVWDIVACSFQIQNVGLLVEIQILSYSVNYLVWRQRVVMLYDCA